MSKHSIRRGALSRSSASSISRERAAGDGVPERKRWRKTSRAFRWTRSIISRLLPRCGVRISTRRPRRVLSQSSSRRSILEVRRNMDLRWNEGGIEVVLLQHGSEELPGIEGFLVLPEQLPLIDNPAPPHVEDGDGDHVFLAVVAEDVDVVIAGGGHLLAFGEVLHGFDRIAVMRGNFELFLLRRLFHPLLEVA